MKSTIANKEGRTAGKGFSLGRLMYKFKALCLETRPNAKPQTLTSHYNERRKDI